MNEEVKELLERILGMQLECTKLLANILCNSNNFEQVEKNQESKKKQTVSQEPQKTKLNHQDKEKEQEAESEKLTKKKAKLVQHSPQTNQETAFIIDDSSTTQRIDKLLDELLAQKPKGKLKPQACYNIINKIMNQFRNLNSKKLELQKLNKNEIIEAHEAKMFQNLRSVLKSFVNNIETQVEPKETNSNNQLLYSCPSCDFRGIQPVHLAHILKKHCDNFYLFSCFICQKDFQSHKLMRKHVEKNNCNSKERKENIKKMVKPIEQSSESEEQGVSIVL